MLKLSSKFDAPTENNTSLIKDVIDTTFLFNLPKSNHWCQVGSLVKSTQEVRTLEQNIKTNSRPVLLLPLAFRDGYSCAALTTFICIKIMIKKSRVS